MTTLLALAALALAPPPPPATAFPGCPTAAAASATVIVPADPGLALPSGAIEPGDTVAVFSDGACVGEAVWNGRALALTVWAGDPTAPQARGFAEGGGVEVRVHDASTGATYASGVDVRFEAAFGTGGGLRADGVYVVAGRADGSGAQVWISELDADGDAPFVEIQTSVPGSALPPLTLVAVGPDGRAYGSVDLSGAVTDAGGRVVVRPEAASGAIAMAEVAEFARALAAFALVPTEDAPARGEAVTAPLDAVVYGAPGGERAPELLAALGQTVQFVDGPGGSIGRLGDGGGSGHLWYPVAPTPGEANPAVVEVEGPAATSQTDGYRLVSAPVLAKPGSPLVLNDLSRLNPVRGVPGSSDPSAAPNVWTAYRDGQYTPARSVEAPLAPGVGILWHWAAPVAPDGGRTAGAAFRLGQAGPALDDAVTGGPYVRAVPTTDDGQYLIGNPYAYPLRLSGLDADGGVLQTAFAGWDPVAGTYVNLYARPEAPDAADVVPVWGGVVAEVSGVAADAFVLTSTSGRVDPGAALEPGPALAPRLAFEIEGTLDGGARVTDRAAHVRQLSAASEGWDAHDATKLMPPGADYALVAPVGTRDGERRRQRVLSLPDGADPTVPLAFTATSAGSFVLRWSGTVDVSGLELVDHVTGDRVPLATASEYAFATDGPAEWSDRFEVRSALATSTGPGGPGVVTVGDPYPNPSSAGATVSVQGATGAVRVEVYDALGRRVVGEDRPLAAGGRSDVRVETGGLAPGVYVVRVRGDGFAEARRLTVAR